MIPKIAIITSETDSRALVFLNHLSHTISLVIGPAAIIFSHTYEDDNQWESLLESKELSLILVNESELSTTPNLSKHYRNQMSEGKSFLKNIPIISLAPPSFYFTKPQQKALLWRTLTNEFASNKIS